MNGRLESSTSDCNVASASRQTHLVKPLRIAIVGAGIAGTATSLFLARAGHAVTLLERTERIGPVGAGFLLQPSGQRVMRELGLLEAAQRVSARIDELVAFLPSGRRLSYLRYGDLAPGLHALGVHRARLFDVIHHQISPAGVNVRLGVDVTSFQIDGQRVCLFERDESIGEFDLLVVADGARSALREQADICVSTIEYDAAALWCVGPCRHVTHALHQRAHRATHLCGLLPMGDDLVTFFWGLRKQDWPELRSRGFAAFRDEVTRFEAMAASVLEHMTGFDQLVFTGFRHALTRPCRNGPVLFIGDAAHASSPHLGQGVNLALTDASAFATSLAGSDSIDQAIADFHRKRRWLIRYYSALSRFLTPFFQSDSRLLPFGRDLTLPLLWRTPGIRGLMLRTLAGFDR